MTTMDGSITGALGMKFARFLVRRAEVKAQARERARTLLQATVRLALHLAGFGCLTLAGFAFSFIAGLIVAGISCFVLSTLMSSPSTNENAPDNQLRR